MTASLTLSLALLAADPVAATAPATPPAPAITVCHDAEGDKDVSVSTGLEGFRPNETFTREFVRVGAAHIIDAPHYFERYRSAGTTDAGSYEIKLDDGQQPAPALGERDWVNSLDGFIRWGTIGRVSPKGTGLGIALGCNTKYNAIGNCRIDISKQSSNPNDAGGLVVTLLTDGDKPADLCLTGMRFNVSAQPWTVSFDDDLGGDPLSIQDTCSTQWLATRASTARSIVVSTTLPGGKTASTTLMADDIKAALGVAAYARGLTYDKASPRRQWLADRIAESKAAFAAAGGNLPPCPGTAPITRPASAPTPAPSPNP